jgi:uncharacterized membrane protein YeiH
MLAAIPLSNMPNHRDKLVLAADLLGTFIFGLEGAMAAIAANLDLLGILVLAFATALAGGIIRDLLIGAIPPNSIRNWRYGAIALFAALVVFFWSRFVTQIPLPFLIVVDAAGLSLFAVAGAAKALEFDVPQLIAVLMRGITGVGGGTVRDILLARVPLVLRSDIYAVAALAGAAVMILALRGGVPSRSAAVAGGMFCFVLRVVAVRRHWNLPHSFGN